jgi:hypothetical protein
VGKQLCKEGWGAGYAGEYLDFVEACLDDRPTKGPACEALEDLRVVVALFTSAESNLWQEAG